MSAPAKNVRLIYAQSSDIKSRTYLEYRRDMKKKAIAELEFLPYLQRLLRQNFGQDVIVEKHGGDKDLWFGKISQDPDYRTFFNNKEWLYEFQYAEETDSLKYFDFKISKVGKKQKQERVPYSDRYFFYILKSEAKYGFFSPIWIINNGEIGAVPAWGSRPAYRVPRDVFLKQCQMGDSHLSDLIDIVQSKNVILNFQHQFLDNENEKFSRELQAVVDEQSIVKIIPKTLEGFYRVCFLLNHLDKTPDTPNVWLIYLLTFYKDKMSIIDFSKFIFALDFLYFKCNTLDDNELMCIDRILQQAKSYVASHKYDERGWIHREADVSAVEQTRGILFAINLLEDLCQDVAVNFNLGVKVDRIFSAVPNPHMTAKSIKSIDEK